MQARKQKSKRGFTLLELLISMALGLIVMAAMTSLFRLGMNSAFLISQRAETQQNMRAAIELITNDISMAGAGLPTGGIQLPTGAGNNGLSRYGCDQTATCYVPAATYPANYLYGIIPGFTNGVQGNAIVAAAPASRNDSITVIYADYNFPLWEYYVSFPSTVSGSTVNLTPNPAYTPAPPALASAGGLQVGDLVMLSNAHGNALGEVTGMTANSLTFANLDVLNINQSGAASNNIQAINPHLIADTTTIAYRIFAVTYYLTVPVNGQLPRLMRQVNGLAPVPVADNIINIQFAYDTYNSNNNGLDANQPNPLGVAESPNNIQKINIWVMGESVTKDGNRSQNMYLATSVSARNMAFRNRYQ